MEFRKLSQLVKAKLTDDETQKIRSIPWYTTTVKLDMEAKGEIERISGSKPQCLRKSLINFL